MRFRLILSVLVICLISGCSAFGGRQPTPTMDIASTIGAALTQAVQNATAEIGEQAPTATQMPELPTATQLVELIEAPSETPTPVLPTPTDTFTPLPPTTTSTATPVVKPSITILGVEKNRAVSIQANNFPADQIFSIRVGPFRGFFNNYVVTGTLDSGNGGSFQFTALLPIQVRDVDMVTVRLDSAEGAFAFNAFTNLNSGSVSYDNLMVSSAMCEVSISPDETKTFRPRQDFDAVWTVKNTSDMVWEVDQVDYKLISGEEMQKYNKLYDLPRTVNPGATLTIIVDILAPDKAGDYTAHWALVKGRTILCHLPLTAIVR